MRSILPTVEDIMPDIETTVQGHYGRRALLARIDAAIAASIRRTQMIARPMASVICGSTASP